MTAAFAGSAPARAQAAGQQVEIPPVNVTAPAETRRPSRPAASRHADRGAPRPQPQRAQPAEQQQATAVAQSQDARTGTVGYYSNSTSVATKTDTPLLNIPQSLSVITKDFIRDQSYQNLTDVTRYVPGVAVHQGEGNRDELVIRGIDSSANFFVNGFRDDVQYFRDVYNTQSIELLKGPAAITFGRGAGGGVLNRTLKEADGTRVYEATAQTGSWGDRRFTLDAGQAINENVAARLNVFYEGADAFRDFNHLERYGINPTVTLTPDDDTRIKLSYEYFHDDRTADRGNPSQAEAGAPAGTTATRFNPTTPFAPTGDFSIFFGSPSLNQAIATVQTGMALIEHDFDNGLTVRNGTIAADYKKFYQNIYPTGGAFNGGVDPTDTFFNLGAYQHTTNRDNVFNQTDFTYKTWVGPTHHTVGFGTEFGRQTGVDIRNTGVFPNGTPTGINTITMNPFSPTYFGPVTFVHHFTNTNIGDGVTTADSNSSYGLNIQSGYVRDTVDITRYLQLIGAVRYDRFDMSALDMNTSIQRARLDNLVSPAAAVIVKPRDDLSVYGAYSVSYLPSTGDQFSALNNGQLILQPQKFENKEIGLKWNINPKYLLSTAIYQLDRTNQPVPVPGAPPGSGLAFPNGASTIRGLEISLNGYITDRWQSQLGYAYTDARVAKDLTAATVALPILAGNRVQLVPFSQFAWWNKYRFTDMWSAGVGVIYFGDSFASSDDTVRLPAFFRFDAGVYANIDRNWKAQLTVENILNTNYWASADGDNNISAGQGRTVRLKAMYKF
ncbi:MAG: TonB-dependent siderophore receptor [Bradyrhizobium sp.]|uniref:TonB-dependent receptor n=1 Tax=Bradyrhizobium sp. TaxID=376 RepID=UPI001DDF277F|nr:TonB-dependent siderophore receptor [Bradyrhizobium sp.]MBV9560883.1 TonB-dependent siderophore receptor [Bradyrhizobium sp.]